MVATNNPLYKHFAADQQSYRNLKFAQGCLRLFDENQWLLYEFLQEDCKNGSMAGGHRNIYNQIMSLYHVSPSACHVALLVT